MNRYGMTLTEMMVTIAIIGLIAAIAIPNFAKTRELAISELCKANLKRIEDAKSMWALDTGASKTDTPTEDELAEYIQGGFPQPIVAGELYAIGNLMTQASCSLHSPLTSWADQHLGLSLFNQLIESGQIPPEAGNEGWMWSWSGLGRFLTFDLITSLSTGDMSSLTYTTPTQGPQFDVDGKTWDFESLTYFPSYSGIYFMTGEQLEYQEAYNGTRTFPGRPELSSFIRISPDTAEITYYDYSSHEYITSTGEIGFLNDDTGQMEYYQESEIPDGG